MKKGEKNRESRNSTATVMAVSPVRPPSETPAALSTKVVTVLVPRRAPVQVAQASAIRAPLMWGSWPFSSSISLLAATPMRVPRVSKVSTNRKAKMTAKKFRLSTWEKSSFRNRGAGLMGAKEARPPDRLGNTLKVPSSGLGTYRPVASQIMPRIQVPRMPKRMFPRTFLMIRKDVNRIPSMAMSTVIPTLWKVPSAMALVKE